MRVSGSRPEFQSGDFGAAFNQGLRNFKERLIEFESKIPQDTIPCRGDEYHLQVLSAFDESQAFCRDFEIRHDDTDIIVQAQQLFRRETDPWIRQSWIGNRARSKPSGFAGDYEMLVKLYDEATPARGLGGYLDLCILDLPLARAVRSRLASAREFLLSQILARGTDVRILAIPTRRCSEYTGMLVQAQQQ
ncbi:MAG: hypothetical protein KDB22_23220, partial [Planctomycetales bacterium]|nr:hypothetical protein [Planctomycetales bacterium]